MTKKIKTPHNTENLWDKVTEIFKGQFSVSMLSLLNNEKMNKAFNLIRQEEENV